MYSKLIGSIQKSRGHNSAVFFDHNTYHRGDFSHAKHGQK